MSLQSQRHIKGLRFETVADAELAGRILEVCYVFETQTFYEYLSVTDTPLIINHSSVLRTGDGGDSRWYAVAGKYERGKTKPSKFRFKAGEVLIIEEDVQHLLIGRLILESDADVILEENAELIIL